MKQDGESTKGKTIEELTKAELWELHVRIMCAALAKLALEYWPESAA